MYFHVNITLPIPERHMELVAYRLSCTSFWDLNIIHQVFRIVAAQFGQRRSRAIKALAETLTDIAATKNNVRF